MVHLYRCNLQGTAGLLLVHIHQDVLQGNCRPVVGVCAVGLVAERYGPVHIFGSKTFSAFLCIPCTVRSAVYTYLSDPFNLNLQLLFNLNLQLLFSLNVQLLFSLNLQLLFSRNLQLL
jgi:hypothetical protein